MDVIAREDIPVDFSLPTDYQNYIFVSKYARWNEEQQRRETWPESVYRYLTYMVGVVKKVTGAQVPLELQRDLYTAMLDMEVLPSMRALATAGPALERDNVAAYNCAYLEVSHPRAFDEAMYILMCGTGVGFSVEAEAVAQLPRLPAFLGNSDEVIVVEDSRIGWADAFRRLIDALYLGYAPIWDVSKLRPAGAILKTFGGRASGPEPLINLFEHTVKQFAAGVAKKAERLTPLQCHSIMTMVGQIVVAGGVRRSAMISLSDPSDLSMQQCKSGAWWKDNPHFALANNSAVWEDRPSPAVFLDEWSSLVRSGSGERGMLNRASITKRLEKHGRRDPDFRAGVNPCAEIILRDQEFCNLSEVIIRPLDTEKDLTRKVQLATIIGTFQSLLTNFAYIRPTWQKNCEEERLLGVSLTGIMDHPMLSRSYMGTKALLEKLRREAVHTNKSIAAWLGIPQSVAVTTVKPSGTVSQLTDVASGIHPRYAPYYLRRVRSNLVEPITQFLIDQGVPYEVDVMNPLAVVFIFPQAAPAAALMREHLTALEHLELARLYMNAWCEHNVSLTVSVKDDEWIAVGCHVYEHFDDITCASFLPWSDHTYAQAPYEECTREEYAEAVRAMPSEIAWKRLNEYETGDLTSSLREFACSGNSCEIV